MEANEVPDKIYLQDSCTTDTIGDLWPEWFDAAISDNSVEYTRIDTFIEKACKYISCHQCEYIDFEDFKNYMKKGE